MASKRDKTTLAAQKARKQKIIAIVGGVLFLGIAAIQGPKLWKQLNPPAPKATTVAVAPTPTAGVVPAAVASPAATRSDTTAVLAGVSVPSGVSAPQQRDGKLTTFSLFESKDPFDPQGADRASAAAAVAPTPAPVVVQPTPPVIKPATPKVTVVPPTHATIEVDGVAQKLVPSGKFPTGSPKFLLVSLRPASARVGVAGGAFSGGKPLVLPLGRQVTVVDGATGTRYVLKLVYTGTKPERTHTFTSSSNTP